MNKIRLSVTVLSLLIAEQCFSNSAFDSNNASFQILAPGVISTEMSEHTTTYDTHTQRIYYTIANPRENKYAIATSQYDNNLKRWLIPEVLDFSGGEYNDADAAISSDGKTLYFVSDRPVKTDDKRNWHIWFSKKGVDGDWSAPINVESLNTKTGEYRPWIIDDGTLYFSTFGLHADENRRDIDLYYSQQVNGKFQSAIALPQGINSLDNDMGTAVSGDGNIMVFASNRKGGQGKSDLYLTKRQKGKWQTPINLAKVNTPDSEFSPGISSDGSIVFFSKRTVKPIPQKWTWQYFNELYQTQENGLGDLYWFELKNVVE